MRAICEACGQVQPPDWQPGDRCVHCGEVARPETRCHWCAAPTPAGRFCRACGSGLVAPELYGAARMLKAAGVDQLSLPERLAALDPEQLANYTRLYAPHARAAERHVEDLAFVETFLPVVPSRAATLEDELLPLLPLPPARLAELKLPPAQATTDAERLQEIAATTPFAPTAELATVARLRLPGPIDFPARAAADAALQSGDRDVREQAALILSSWRYTLAAPFVGPVRELTDVLHERYVRTADPAAALGLALLKLMYEGSWISVTAPPELLGADDPDLAFGAALALGEADQLRAALTQPLRRFAAARVLARTGQGDGLAEALPHLSAEELDTVLTQLRYRTTAPVTTLRPALLRLLESPAAGRPLRETAAHLLLRDHHPEDALRIVQAVGPTSSLVGEVLKQPDLAPADLADVCRLLLATDDFRRSSTGVRELARSGRLPDDFVPAVFEGASESGQQELAGFAQEQLQARADQRLHAALWRFAARYFPARPGLVVWWALDAWYSHHSPDHPRLRFEQAAATYYFGSVRAFLEQLLAVLEKPDYAQESYTGPNQFGAYAQDIDPNVLPDLLNHPDLTRRLQAVLLRLALDPTADSNARGAIVPLLQLLTATPKWRDEAITQLWELRQSPTHRWDVERAFRDLGIEYPELD